MCIRDSSYAVDDKGKISKGNIEKAIKDLGKKTHDNADEYDMLNKYKKLLEDDADVQVKIKTTKYELEEKVINQYPKLSIPEIKELVVDKKWMFSVESHIKSEMDNISHRLTQRIKELAERYETPLPKLSTEVEELTSKVENHLKQMNFKW